ncbi:MAG: hypothetical protein U9R79_01855 [Armatimonadota bacterium]|nr:hypothetical protein [Armatimonadota bacterium]
MLPNFLHIGAAKCASSWLWRCLKEHPQVYVPDAPDNVNFFTVHYHRGVDWYQRTYFGGHAGEPAVGEFSNSYMCYHPALERIARDLPGVRLTMTLRNPVVRAYLSWAHIHLKRGKYGFDPEAGVGIPFQKVLHHHGHAWFRTWIEPGFYARHLRRVHELVSPERVLVTLYDDLAADNAAYLQRYFSFLGVDPNVKIDLVGEEVNPDAERADPAALDPAFRAELREVYAEDIAALEGMLDRDLSHWR